MAELTLTNLTKRYAQVLAVDDWTFRVEDGELLVLVGPSGCGKTTALRLIAGLEQPTSGQIHLGQRIVNDLAPRHRDVGMVFQDYALYPQWNVFDNLAFGLRMRGQRREEICRRVAETAALLGIDDLLSRRPETLSGGQQQRVALGRALVRRPQLFLLDEPFSGLDAPLRQAMRRHWAAIQDQLGTTSIHVTHDQDEAMLLGRRIVVLRGGRVQQIGSPWEIYQQPANRFVAEFIGNPAMNFFAAHLVHQDGSVWIDAGDFRGPLLASSVAGPPASGARDVILGIRPEHLDVRSGREQAGGVSWLADVLLVRPLGALTQLELKSASHRFAACVPAAARYHQGQRVEIESKAQNWRLFDPPTGDALPLH